jgi:hypothetical protein
MSKKIVSTLLTLSTIVWVSGLATFVPTAQAVTINNGDLIRGPDGIKTYIVNNLGYKRHIFNPAVFGMYKHFSWGSIKTVTQSVLDSYITSDLYRADGDTKVYSLEEVNEAAGSAIKHWLDMTPAEFTAKGYNWNQVFIVNAVEKDYYSTGDPMTASGVIIPVGSVSVTLASGSPVATTFVQGQATANLAHYTFTNNSSSEVKVTGLVLNRIGISADATLVNVYLFDGSLRLTDAASVSGGKVTFNASAGLFTVPANSSKTIAVKSDILATASGQTIGVALASVTSAATVSGSFPITGAIHSIASATLADVTVTSPTPAGTPSSDPMNDVKVWGATFAPNKKVNFTRMALRQINSIQTADIQNFRLLIDGTQVASVANLDANGYVNFVFNQELSSGSKDVKVLADIIGGSSRKIEMSLRNKADLSLTDSEYGVNILSSSNFPVTAGQITVSEGTMTVEKTTASPSGNVAVGGTDVLLGEWKFTARGEPIKVETLTAGYAHVNTGGTTTVASTLRNGRIMVNGVQVGSNTTTAQAGTAFTTNFVVTPGTPATVQFRADLFDNDSIHNANIVSTNKITAQLVHVHSNASKTISLGTTDIPSENKDANQVVLAGGSMTLAKKTNYANQTINVPQTGFKIGEWTLTGGTAEIVNVHTFSVNVDEQSGSTFSEADLTDMYIVYGTNTTSYKSTVTAENNDWSVSFALAKSQVINIALYATIGSSVTNDTDAIHTNLTVTGTGAVSGASISEAAKEGQYIIYGAASITASRSGSTADAAIVADNQSVQTTAYKFETINDSYRITEIVLGVVNASAVSSVNLKDGSTVLATMPGATAVTFTGLSIPVTANSSKTLTAELVLSAVGSGAGTTGAEITTGFTSGRAIPTSTGVEAGIHDHTVVGNAMYVYKAIPTVTKVTLPSVQLRNGEKVLLKFTVGSTGDDISWSRLLFTLLKDDATTLATSTTYLFDVTGGANTNVGGSFAGSNLSATTTAGSLTFTATNEQQVSGSRTYELRSTVANANADGDFITTSLKQDGGYAAPTSTTAVISADSDASIIWSDMSAASHSTATGDWSNDYLVKSLPISDSLNW